MRAHEMCSARGESVVLVARVRTKNGALTRESERKTERLRGSQNEKRSAYAGVRTKNGALTRSGRLEAEQIYRLMSAGVRERESSTPSSSGKSKTFIEEVMLFPACVVAVLVPNRELL